MFQGLCSNGANVVQYYPSYIDLMLQTNHQMDRQKQFIMTFAKFNNSLQFSFYKILECHAFYDVNLGVEVVSVRVSRCVPAH